jgi:hypothetical protein
MSQTVSSGARPGLLDRISLDWWAVLTAVVLAVLVGFDLLPPVGW